MAEWCEAQREEEEERRVMSDGILRARGLTNMEFFQVDKRDEIRQEEQRMKQEQERMNKEEERKKKEEEQQEESQSLLEVADRNSVTPSQKIKYENFSKKFRNYGKNP